jgi:hypothetical protein
MPVSPAQHREMSVAARTGLARSADLDPHCRPLLTEERRPHLPRDGDDLVRIAACKSPQPRGTGRRPGRAGMLR